MSRRPLTNRFTTVKYLQYGVMMQLEYNGELKDALTVLEHTTGIRTVSSGSTVTRNGFLPIGLSSTTVIEEQ